MKQTIILAALFILLIAGLVSCQKDSTPVAKVTTGTADTTIPGTTPSKEVIAPLVKNELITITPSVRDSGAVTLSAITGSSYNCLNNQLLIDEAGSGTAKQTLTIKGVDEPDECTPGTQKAAGSNVLYMLVDGNYDFDIVSGGTTYSGSVNKKGDTYVFTWSYTTGVVISPLTITK